MVLLLMEHSNGCSKGCILDECRTPEGLAPGDEVQEGVGRHQHHHQRSMVGTCVTCANGLEQRQDPPAKVTQQLAHIEQTLFYGVYS
jgi:hypothetical protein